MRYQVSRVWRVVLLVPLIAFLSGAGSATASYAAPTAGPVTVTSPVTYIPLPGTRDVFPHTDEEYAEVLMTPAFTMQPGDMRRVTDQLDVRIPSGDGTEVNNKLICFDQHGNEIDETSTGTNVNDSHAYQWNVSMLITPPAQNPAENYFCQIWTYANDKNPNGVMNVLAPAPGQTTYGTWLEVSSGNEVGAQGWLYYNCTPATLHTTCCDPEDTTHTCQYIGGSGRPSAVNLYAYWLAADNATTFDAVATFMITDCWASLFGGTDACLPGDRGDGILGQSSAEGETWLDVDQLYPNGSVCQVNQAYSEESTNGQVLLSEGFDISDAQHHRPLYYDLSAPVSQLCQGSRRFTVHLYIGWTAGNPVKIDGGNINVIDSVRETATAVPDVVGHTQAQADEAIQANGLYASAADYVTSTAPPGTVLAENSPAGTIEPDGSPVQLTVSLGQVTVPDVIGDKPAAAVQAIKNAGLTAVTLAPISNCTDPGTVQYQDPAGGAQVSPGSQVDIRVTACLR
jgi:hypothetical protein